jgi:hypothetical protein
LAALVPFILKTYLLIISYKEVKKDKVSTPSAKSLKEGFWASPNGI